ncbi:MAG TPA: NAD(P)-dependent oxidoreductase [Armatimonadota bacterium]|jgi:phosphoglycerate dehydrogenase-like enzyme
MNLLHIASGEANRDIFNPIFRSEIARFGELRIVEDGSSLSGDERTALIRGCDVLLTGWGAAPVSAAVASEPGTLRYVCHITGEMRRTVPIEIIDAGIPVTNWGDTPASGVAEGAMALLLGAVKEIHLRVKHIERGGWGLDPATHGGTLEGLNVGIYGFGAIGRRFVDLLRPFGSTIRIFDPFAAGLPDDCLRVSSLEELFDTSEAIVIHAALCDATAGSVTAGLLAKLPDHGVVVNTARGGIIDQDALFAELESGRLRAGLDVLDPDSLPEDHPARGWENLILTGHHIENPWPLDGRPATALTPMQRVCVENLRRFEAGEPLKFTMDRTRYLLST